MREATTIGALLRIKQVLDGLKGIDQTRLTEREQYAYTDTLAHVYDRAAFFLANLRPLSCQKGNEDAPAVLI